MKIFIILLGVALLLGLIFLALAYVCYRITFRATKSAKNTLTALLDTDVFLPFTEDFIRWSEAEASLEHEELSVTSFDGLKLYGKYYEIDPAAPIELMFHGYRGSAERDLGGGIERAFAVRHNVITLDLRSAGKSEGKTITFGIYESRDCLAWLELIRERFGPDHPVILTGISMGAATVMMSAARELPDNILYILADCGYTSPREIICETIGKLKLPIGLAYFFVRAGARIFGRFDPDALSAIEAMKKCRVPVIFFHGGKDHFVPSSMSRANYEACAAYKKLVIVPDADHALAYPVDPEGYLEALRQFEAELAGFKTKL